MQVPDDPRHLQKPSLSEEPSVLDTAGCYICGGAHYANQCPKKDGGNNRQANQEGEEEDELLNLDTEPSEN
ncbi:hypothetical protein ACJ72_06073 [Emergomyces africanus]|uniref:Uncharacterized protein n=1 Tax=Emergomyces africanus TaxID=1955775 RepID=A0A1B7NS94_9EURO|nr:hypothetical protein ACJ72_06073 [Emergomyces africanus]